jgi:ABC-type polysaccharide/polyol phosphate export permease
MMFLSGVFFPREQLPTPIRVVSDWLPLTNAVELVRPLFLDQWPAHPCAACWCWRRMPWPASGSPWR